MQNKPNFRKAKMNVSNIITRNYKNFIPLAGQKNKPNSNPIKPNLRRARMIVNLTLTKDYRKNDDFAVRKNKAKTNPISEKAKMNANAFLQKDYENETAFRPKKTNPNKPNFKRQISVFCFLSSVIRRPSSVLSLLSSVLCSQMQPKLLNFHRKKSLTVWLNSVKYRFLCNEREYFYEELYGKERKRRA